MSDILFSITLRVQVVTWPVILDIFFSLSDLSIMLCLTSPISGIFSSASSIFFSRHDLSLCYIELSKQIK